MKTRKFFTCGAIVVCLVFSSFVVQAGRTPFSSGATAITTSGSVAVGARSIVFVISSDFTGTIMGAPVTGVDLMISPPIPAGEVAEAIPYVVTTGSLRYWGFR